MLPLCVGPNPKAGAAMQSPGCQVALYAADKGGMGLPPEMAHEPISWLGLFCYKLNEGTPVSFSGRTDQPPVDVIERQGTHVVHLRSSARRNLMHTESFFLLLLWGIPPLVTARLAKLDHSAQLPHSDGPVLDAVDVAFEFKLLLQRLHVILLKLLVLRAPEGFHDPPGGARQVQRPLAEVCNCDGPGRVGTDNSGQVPLVDHCELELVPRLDHGVLSTGQLVPRIYQEHTQLVDHTQLPSVCEGLPAGVLQREVAERPELAVGAQLGPMASPHLQIHVLLCLHNAPRPNSILYGYGTASQARQRPWGGGGPRQVQGRSQRSFAIAQR
mmetsp:Transcript_85780/g.154479  ORF Transcript_85780/g.154479 Transcript_85780/m.154479 type:complete len:328 (+) Transcript_85780:2079-3062(+)